MSENEAKSLCTYAYFMLAGGLNQKLSIYRRDPSKNRIIPTSVKHLKYHAHNISTLKFYPDGALLVSG